MNIPANLHYTKDHEWIRIEGNNAFIGVTEFAQSELGYIVYEKVYDWVKTPAVNVTRNHHFVEPAGYMAVVPVHRFHPVVLRTRSTAFPKMRDCDFFFAAPAFLRHGLHEPHISIHVFVFVGGRP